MISSDNLMHSSRDVEWFHTYTASMGKDNFYSYANRLCAFLDKAAPGKIIIEPLVKTENEDLFAKCVSWFIYEGLLPIYFADDFTYIKKWSKETSAPISKLPTPNS